MMFLNSLTFLSIVKIFQALGVKRDLRCGSNIPLTTDNGVITSHAGYDNGHHYGKNLNCIWTITAPVGKYVELVADNFSVSLNPVTTCYSDYLQLFDGPDVNSPSLGKFCGTSFVPISSNGNSLTLKFHTTSYGQYGGFRIHYNFTNSVVHSCPKNAVFTCDNGWCILRRSELCDTDDDCGDDSDERNCTGPVTCPSGKFTCRGNNHCISSSFVCDGDNDCRDGYFGGSDESYSLCHSFHTRPPIFTFPPFEG